MRTACVPVVWCRHNVQVYRFHLGLGLGHGVEDWR